MTLLIWRSQHVCGLCCTDCRRDITSVRASYSCPTSNYISVVSSLQKSVKNRPLFEAMHIHWPPLSFLFLVFNLLSNSRFSAISIKIGFCHHLVCRIARNHCVRCGLLLQTEWRGQSVCVSICLLVTFVSPAKTAEPIKMRIGGWTRVGPRNHILDWFEILQEGTMLGIVRPLKSIENQCWAALRNKKNQ